MNVPVPDRSVPSDKDAFLKRVDELAGMVRNGRFLGVHCRACIGRSSMLAVSILVRIGWNLEEAFAAVESARGFAVPDTPEQRKWVIENIGPVIYGNAQGFANEVNLQ